MTRRNFLKMMGLGAAAAVIPSSIVTAASVFEPTIESPKKIIERTGSIIIHRIKDGTQIEIPAKDKLSLYDLYRYLKDTYPEEKIISIITRYYGTIEDGYILAKRSLPNMKDGGLYETSTGIEYINVITLSIGDDKEHCFVVGDDKMYYGNNIVIEKPSRSLEMIRIPVKDSFEPEYYHPRDIVRDSGHRNIESIQGSIWVPSIPPSFDKILL